MCTEEVEITAAARWVTAVLESRANSICLQTCFCTSIHPEVYVFPAECSRAKCTSWFCVNSWHDATHEEENTQMGQLYHDYYQCLPSFLLRRHEHQQFLHCSPYMHFSGSLPQSSNIHDSMASFPCLVGRLRKQMNANLCMPHSDQRRLLNGVLRGAGEELPLLDKQHQEISELQRWLKKKKNLFMSICRFFCNWSIAIEKKKFCAGTRKKIKWGKLNV